MKHIYWKIRSVWYGIKSKIRRLQWQMKIAKLAMKTGSFDAIMNEYATHDPLAAESKMYLSWLRDAKHVETVIDGHMGINKITVTFRF